MKLPHLRAQLESVVGDNGSLAGICRDYADATSYREQLRYGGDPVVLAEYDVLCLQLENEFEAAIAAARPTTILVKNS